MASISLTISVEYLLFHKLTAGKGYCQAWQWGQSSGTAVFGNEAGQEFPIFPLIYFQLDHNETLPLAILESTEEALLDHKFTYLQVTLLQ